MVDVLKADKTSGRPAVCVAADVDIAVKNCVLGITVHLLPLNVVIEVAISGLDIRSRIVQISGVVSSHLKRIQSLLNHIDTSGCLPMPRD